MSGRGRGGRGGRGRGRGRGAASAQGRQGSAEGAPSPYQPASVNEPGPTFPTRELPVRIPPTEEELAYIHLSLRINETIRTKPYYYSITPNEEFSAPSVPFGSESEPLAVRALEDQRESVTQYLSHVAHFFPEELFQVSSKAKRKRRVISIKKKREEFEEMQRPDEKLDDEMVISLMPIEEGMKQGEEDEEDAIVEEEDVDVEEDELEFEHRSDDDEFMDEDELGGDNEKRR